MAKLLLGSIDPAKIDMSKSFTRKDGKEVIDVVVWLNDTPDEFGNDASIQQSVKKGDPKIYLGNLKYHVKS